MLVHEKRVEPWKVTLVDTGDDSMTGGRLLRVAKYIMNEECFCFTYGDGVSNVDISKLIAFHIKHGKDATLTATYPSGRFGALDIKNNQILNFSGLLYNVCTCCARYLTNFILLYWQLFKSKTIPFFIRLEFI